jgi:hypothetical protein
MNWSPSEDGGSHEYGHVKRFEQLSHLDEFVRQEKKYNVT